MAASENVEDLRLELSKDEDEKLFPEVSDVFGKDDGTTISATGEEEYGHNVDESSPVRTNDSPDEVTTECCWMLWHICSQDTAIVSHKRTREEESEDDDGTCQLLWKNVIVHCGSHGYSI